MFFSESHVLLHDELFEKLENSPEIEICSTIRRRKKDLFKHSRPISASEDNITTRFIQQTKSLDSKENNFSKNALNYNAETDSDLENEFDHLYNDNLICCDICSLESQLTIYLQLPDANDVIESQKVIKNKKKHQQMKSKHSERKIRSALNVNDYKDCAHKMEEFSADSERKWTLEYFYDKQEAQPKLSKIIIGRGQNDEYPELNSVHLVDAIKSWQTADWRYSLLDALKKNKSILEKFSMFPTNKTCIFCIDERQRIIFNALKSGHSLSKPGSISCSGEIKLETVSCSGEINDAKVKNLLKVAETSKEICSEKHFKEEKLKTLQIGVRKNMFGVIKKLKQASKFLSQNKKKSSEIIEEEDLEEFEVL